MAASSSGRLIVAGQVRQPALHAAHRSIMQDRICSQLLFMLLIRSCIDFLWRIHHDEYCASSFRMHAAGFSSCYLVDNPWNHGKMA